MTGSNTYTGITILNGGTLQVGNGGTGASIGSASGVSLAVGTELVFSFYSDAQSVLGSITGSGSLLAMGGGTLSLSGSNTYSGGTTLNNFSIVAQSATAAGHRHGYAQWRNPCKRRLCWRHIDARTGQHDSRQSRRQQCAQPRPTGNNLRPLAANLVGSGTLSKIGGNSVVLSGNNSGFTGTYINQASNTFLSGSNSR